MASQEKLLAVFFLQSEKKRFFFQKMSQQPRGFLMANFGSFFFLGQLRRKPRGGNQILGVQAIFAHFLRIFTCKNRFSRPFSHQFSIFSRVANCMFYRLNFDFRECTSENFEKITSFGNFHGQKLFFTGSF